MEYTKGPWIAPSAGIWTEDGKCLIATLGSRSVVASRRKYAKRYGESAQRVEMALIDADARRLSHQREQGIY